MFISSNIFLKNIRKVIVRIKRFLVQCYAIHFSNILLSSSWTSIFPYILNDRKSQDPKSHTPGYSSKLYFYLAATLHFTQGWWYIEMKPLPSITKTCSICLNLTCNLLSQLAKFALCNWWDVVIAGDNSFTILALQFTGARLKILRYWETYNHIQGNRM